MFISFRLMIIRFFKFAIVGGLGTIVNEAVYVFSSKAIPIAVSLALAIEVFLVLGIKETVLS